jgi:hypothetical protein
MIIFYEIIHNFYLSEVKFSNLSLIKITYKDKTSFVAARYFFPCETWKVYSESFFCHGQYKLSVVSTSSPNLTS